jgi:hypothetical protein
VLTSTTNLIQLQWQLTKITTGNFEFRNTRNGARIVTKEMADFSAMKKYLEKNKPSLLFLLPEVGKTCKSRYPPSSPQHPG